MIEIVRKQCFYLREFENEKELIIIDADGVCKYCHRITRQRFPVPVGHEHTGAKSCIKDVCTYL